MKNLPEQLPTTDAERVELLKIAKRLIATSADILLTTKGQEDLLQALSSVDVLIDTYES